VKVNDEVKKHAFPIVTNTPGGLSDSVAFFINNREYFF
jgi:hypothetical protein